MVSKTLNQNDWDALAYSIARGRCILMLGPDIMAEEVSGQRIPLVHQLSRVLAETVRSDEYWVKRLGPDLTDLAHVAQVYYNKQGGRTYLEIAAGEFYERKRATLCSSISNLAALPFKLIIDTTPGLNIDDCIRRQGKTCASHWYHFGPRAEEVPEEETMLADATSERPIVYHLYGCVRAPESLVLTENDLLRFLVAVISSNPPLPKNILSEIRNPENCFLFLGFGFRHWYLRILLHILDATSHRNRPSFALENFDAAASGYDVERTTLFFQEGYKINFFDMDLQVFTEQLRQNFEKHSAQKSDGDVQELAPDAPIVFLCHANEDKPQAEVLARDLQKKGFRPWLDKEDLCGGEDWDHTIPRLISNEINYFVVLQSKALLARDIGYVNKEIELAIEKQHYVRAGGTFIVPVLIEKCEKLDLLKKWQSIDLTASNGIVKLLNTLTRDVQRRKKKGK